MKKRLFVLLVAIITAAFMLPSISFADNNTGLEKAIKAVKQIITIPDSYNQFNYRVSTMDNRNVWYLNWSRKDALEYSINVSVDESGTIINYNDNKPYSGTQGKLPKISRQEAKTMAQDFIKMVNPGLVPQLSLRDTNNNSLGEVVYHFQFFRLVNGILYSTNSVNIDVDTETGSVRNYHLSWTEGLAFPSPDGVISLEAAQKAFMEKLGLRLSYNYSTDNDEIRIFPVYTPVYDYGYYLDAFTGDRVNTGSTYYGYSGGELADKKTAAMRDGAGSGTTGPALSQEELLAVEKISRLVSRDDAEKIARNTGILELGNEFKVERASLNRDWPLKDDYVWEINFIKGSRTDSKSFSSIFVRIDAKSGNIKGFYINSSGNVTGNPVFDADASKKAAEKFLQEFIPDKFKQTVYEESRRDVVIPMDIKNKSHYNFKFTRVVNGAFFPGNTVNVGVNAITGKITDFNMAWFNMDFPSLDKAVSIESVYEQLFNDIGLQLEYKPGYSQTSGLKIIPGSPAKPVEIKLVYALKPGKPILFDAYAGTILNYNGQPYKEPRSAEYTDISGHYAEQQISLLAEYGISLAGKEFKPDSNITQSDFLYLLSRTMNYHGGEIPGSMDDKQLEELYRFLAREGIVKDGEKDPKGAITREDSVKFIIRALKYDKVADLKDIFKYPFLDADQVSPDLLGYITIAYALDIAKGDGGYFYPGNGLTRAEAAVIIYNYLRR